MTFAEYLYRLKAHRLARIDKEYDIHLSTWLNQRAGAQKKKGKETVSAFKTFKDFFDYEKRINEIDKPPAKKMNERHKRMAQLAARANT